MSRQQETELHLYYGWTPYWQSGMAAPALAGKQAETSGDPNLRSSVEVTGYHIQARDGEIGHVEDFLANDEDWVIRYMIVDTRNWLPGKKVLVSPTWIEEVDWLTRDVHVDLKRETIRHSPEFDPDAPVNREYEMRLYDYYGRPKYWVRM